MIEIIRNIFHRKIYFNNLCSLSRNFSMMTTFADKDYNSAAYSSYRPNYSEKLFNKIYDYHSKNSGNYNNALDIATGTGQIAHILSSKFSNVYATDISETMLSNAHRGSNINYSISTAEDLSQFPSSKFDMLSVGQSAHWFRLQEFFEEANRVLVPNGTLAIFGYTFHVIKGYNEISEMLLKFSIEEEIGKYWDERRIIINDLYRSIVLPEQFKNVEIIRNEIINGGEISGEIFMEENWSIYQMANYMKTWSSYKDYMAKNKDIQQDPVDKLMNKIELAIGLKPGQKLHIIWPMVLILATKKG